MIEVLGLTLPIIINLLLIVLLAAAIMLGIKFIKIADGVNSVIEEAQEKVASFDITCSFINKLSYLGLGIICKMIKKAINQKGKEDSDYNG